MAWWREIRASITRKKSMSSRNPQRHLERCLSTADLSFVGIGCMLGSGVYILTGEVAGVIAGPAAIVSFAISGIAAFIAALCYLECATKYPETGAPYLYAYVSMGELVAFIVGWNAIILRILAVAFIARGWSAYIDHAIGGRVSNFTIDTLLNGEQWDVPLVSQYPDIVAGVISLVACSLVAIGTQVSSKANAVFVLINVVTICLVIIAALVYADLSNLFNNGGFTPNGFDGIMKGAAACFAGYCGFEAIAFGAEEAQNPKRSLPIAIILAFVVSILCYMGGVFAITILADWKEINPESPFVSAFEAVGATWMKIFVAIGALCSMTGGIINGAFCFARAIYVMGRDGLLPAIFAKINSSSHTPAFSTMFGATLSTLVTIFMDFVSVIEFLSFACFFEFILVAMACIILRYNPRQHHPSGNHSHHGDGSCNERKRNASNQDNVTVIADDETTPLLTARSRQYSCSDINYDINDNSKSISHESRSTSCPFRIKKSVGLSHSINQTQNEEMSQIIVMQEAYLCMKKMNLMKRWIDENPINVVVASLTTAILNAIVVLFLLTYKMDELRRGNGVLMAVIVACGVCAILGCFPLWIMKQYPCDRSFKVPMMPLIPLVSILFNLILMTRFGPVTWLELLIWTTIGVVFYFSYGIQHSKERLH